MAANVIRLSWLTTSRDDAAVTSPSSEVSDDATDSDSRQRVRLRPARPNSTLDSVRLLNGSRAACDDEDATASLLIDCDPGDVSRNVKLPIFCSTSPVFRYVEPHRGTH